jgi:hypothetical protein
MMRMLRWMVVLLLLALPWTVVAQQQSAPGAAASEQPAVEEPAMRPVRALRPIFTAAQPRATVLASNAGWQPIYTQQLEAKEGDLLRVIGQTQLTLDSAPEVGQQLRLTVNGEAVGTQAIEINTAGGHHLPMLVYGLVLVTSDGPQTVSLEGSSFHSDGDFPVTVDQQENLSYGNLLVEQYRSYPDLMAAWADGALLLTDLHQAPPLSQSVWGQQPYVQEPLASLLMTANQGDLLRVSAQAVGVGSFGLEQFSGVLTADGRAISPYGGQNVDVAIPQAPMLIEGVERVVQDGRQFLEHRVYGAFGHGLTILPESARFEVAHFGSYGRGLQRFGQEQVALDEIPSGPPVEVYSMEIELEEGDLLRLTGSLQFGQPQSPYSGVVDCRLQLLVEGPSGSKNSSLTQKSLTATRSVLPLTGFLTVRAQIPGVYRIALLASGSSEQGPVALRLDASQSQLQYMQFGQPRQGGPGL